MTVAPTPLYLVALSEHDWLRESAVRALGARSIEPERANARLAAWLAIALRAGASRVDLVSRGAQLADLLDCYCPDADITPAQRAVAADALCRECGADWRTELARHTAWVLHNAGTRAALARAGDLLRLSRWFHNTLPLTRPAKPDTQKDQAA